MRCITIMGPPHGGKTTLAERLAAQEPGAVKTDLGRGLTLHRLQLSGEGWAVIDCPGSIERLPDCRTAMLAADAAVICVPPDPDHAVLAAPYLRAAEASGTPTLLFINRMDEAEGRVRDVVAALQDYATHPIVLRQIPIRRDGAIIGAIDVISERAWQYRKGQSSALIEIPESAAEREHEARESLLEELSELDDWLLEELIEEREPAAGAVYEICKKMLTEGNVVPALLGSAANGNGILRLTKALRHEVPEAAVLRARLAAEAGAEPLAVSFHADHRRHMGKVVFLRALGEGVKIGARVGGEAIGSLLDLGEGKTGAEIAPGMVLGAVKSDHLHTGRLFGADGVIDPPGWAVSPLPMLARVLAPVNERDEAKLSTLLNRLAEDEPGLEIAKEDKSGRPIVRVQGPMHLRELSGRLSEIFGIEVTDDAVADLYRETITRSAEVHYRHRKQTGGAGQFADVRLRIAPAARGAGFSFDEEVKGGAVPRNYIPSVEAGAQDAMERGPLGFPVIDVRVTLHDGQHHSVDSSDFAFRTAGRAGVAQGLGEAAPVLLQPIHLVTCHIPSVFSGALVPMVASLHGQVLGFERDPAGRGWDEFRALLPGSVLGELPHLLRSATQGTGYFDAAFDHYEEVYGKEATRLAERAGRG
ncbi:elongation factor G [Paralimibaculum aggregatum]|uniref:Elongation factor G n=1 Tax=Paralimibaculum aggregatum TaxID=3036245 RepID=A0ABQ6LU64_9RHOB|nr:elongation factor G [Limibaculum sp. NKW23]GMG85619.1 elongation factor G [Limibaculum sp. NKW23]